MDLDLLRQTVRIAPFFDKPLESALRFVHCWWLSEHKASSTDKSVCCLVISSASAAWGAEDSWKQDLESAPCIPLLHKMIVLRILLYSLLLSEILGRKRYLCQFGMNYVDINLEDPQLIVVLPSELLQVTRGRSVCTTSFPECTSNILFCLLAQATA